MKHHDRGLLLIAIFKFVKVVALILAGIGAFELLHPAVHDRVEELVWSVGSPWIRDHLEHLMNRTVDHHPGRVRALGIVAFAYAGLFLAEGIGLWLEKRWGEWLTVIITGSLIPFEVYELVRRFTLLRVGTLLINAAVVVYLVLRIRSPRSKSKRVSRRSR